MFEMQMAIVDSTIKVMRSDPFKVFTLNKSNKTVCTSVYRGPKHFLFDTKIDCLTAINRDLSEDYIILNPHDKDCFKEFAKEDKYRTYRTYWEDLPCRPLSEVNFDEFIQIKSYGDSNYLYCSSHNISVYNEKERPCPQHVFSLPYDTPFKIGTQTYNFISIKSKSKVSFSLEHSQKLNYKLMPDFHEYRFDKTEQELKELLTQNTLSYPFPTKNGVIFISMGVINIIIIMALVYSFWEIVKKII